MGDNYQHKVSQRKTNPPDKLSLVLQDVSYLLNRGYDKRRAIDFVASRYLLDRSLRNFIFRTLSSDYIADQTKAKLLTVEQLCKRNMGVDGFNILITIREIIRKKPVYYCYDHVVRDISGNHGRFQHDWAEKKALQTLVGILLKLPLEEFTILLDKPVSHSGKIAAELRNELIHQATKPTEGLVSSETCPTFVVATVKSPDYELAKFDVVASHDSIVIQKARWIFDIPHHLITLGLLTPKLTDVRSLLEGLGDIPNELKVDFNQTR